MEFTTWTQQLSALVLFRVKLTLRSQKGLLLGMPLQMLLVIYILRVIASAVIVPEELVEKHGFIKPPLFSYIGDIKGTPEPFYDTFAGDGLSDIKAYHDCFQTTYYPLNRPNQCNVGFTIANFTQFASFPTEAQSLNESATNTSSYTLLIDDIRYESGMGAKAEEIIQGLEKAGEYLFTDEPPEQKKKKAHIKSLQFKFFPAKETAHPRFNHLAAQTVLLRMLMAPNFRTEFQVHENTHVFQWEPVIRVIIPGIVWIFSLPLTRLISQTAAEIRSHYRYYFKLSGLSPTTFTLSLCLIYTLVYLVLTVIASSLLFNMGPFRGSVALYIPSLLWWCFNCSITAIVLGERWDGNGSSGYFFLSLLPWIILRQYGTMKGADILIHVMAVVWPQYSLAELLYALVESFAEQEPLPFGRLIFVFVAQSTFYVVIMAFILFRLSSRGQKKRMMQAEAVEGLYDNNDDEKLPESVVQELMNMSTNNKDYSLRVLNLQHEYIPGNPILRGISFGVKNNECLGFLGMNGAGKSTAIRSLTGMINPNGGRAILNGDDLIPFGEELTGKIGICTQQDILYSSMTVLDHLRLFCHVKKLSPTTHGSLIQKLLEDFNITLVKDRIVGELSGGNRRKLSLALSFISCPDIILLDEPTTGIDIRARKMIWDVVLKMKERCCILLTSHSMDEIAYLCDRICILNEGVITFIGSPLGTTYELLIRTTQWTSTPRIKEAITDIFKPFRASLVSRIGSMMTFHLTCSDEGDLSRILKLMETLQSRQGLEGIVEICAGEANLTGIWIKEIGN